MSDTGQVNEEQPPTREPKSVYGKTNVCLDGEVAGGALTNCSMLPLQVCSD